MDKILKENSEEEKQRKWITRRVNVIEAKEVFKRGSGESLVEQQH